MQINEYQQLAMRTNDGKITDRVAQYITDVTDDETHYKMIGELLNGALGLTGEAGEVADMVKKHIFHGHDLTTEELVKELGDVCWYLALMCNAIGVNLEDVMALNIEKLKTRYPDGFSEAASINRSE